MHLKNIHKLFLVFQATTLLTIAGMGRSTVDCSTCVGTCVYEPTSESTICYKKLSQVSLQVGAEAPPPVAPQESQGIYLLSIICSVHMYRLDKERSYASINMD